MNAASLSIAEPLEKSWLTKIVNLSSLVKYNDQNLESRDFINRLWTLEGAQGSRSSVKNGSNILQSRDDLDGLWTLEGKLGSRGSMKIGPNVLELFAKMDAVFLVGQRNS